MVGVGGSFNSAAIGTTPDSFGNITGNPAFVALALIDPRPAPDGPGEFFDVSSAPTTT